MKFTQSIFTDKGGRAVNEDSVDHIQVKDRHCFIVCDGLGGHGMGDVASRLAVKSFKDSFVSSAGIEEFAEIAFFAAQSALIQAQKEDRRLSNMRTTAVVLCTEGKRGIVLHMGDSRFYHFRDGKIIRQTKDHSVPQMLVMTGEISESEIRRHPDRNRLLRALGDENDEVRFARSDFEIREGDAFLLCSDGFWEEVEEESMEAMLIRNKKADKWLNEMAALARERGKDRNMDNYTALAVMVD